MTTEHHHLIMLMAAFDAINIYPAATLINGQEIKRTEWQDGWNECALTISKNLTSLCKWFEEIKDKDSKCTITELIKDDFLSFSIENNEIKMFLFMNDIFNYASADEEEISISDIKEINRLYLLYGYDGLVAFVAKKRKCEPLEEYRTQKYKDAYGNAFIWSRQ
jgi:hypothetical protein